MKSKMMMLTIISLVIVSMACYSLFEAVKQKKVKLNEEYFEQYKSQESEVIIDVDEVVQEAVLNEQQQQMVDQIIQTFTLTQENKMFENYSVKSIRNSDELLNDTEIKATIKTMEESLNPYGVVSGIIYSNELINEDNPLEKVEHEFEGILITDLEGTKVKVVTSKNVESYFTENNMGGETYFDYYPYYVCLAPNDYVFHYYMKDHQTQKVEVKVDANQLQQVDMEMQTLTSLKKAERVLYREYLNTYKGEANEYYVGNMIGDEKEELLLKNNQDVELYQIKEEQVVNVGKLSNVEAVYVEKMNHKTKSMSFMVVESNGSYQAYELNQNNELSSIYQSNTLNNASYLEFYQINDAQSEVRALQEYLGMNVDVFEGMLLNGVCCKDGGRIMKKGNIDYQLYDEASRQVKAIEVYDENYEVLGNHVMMKKEAFLDKYPNHQTVYIDKQVTIYEVMVDELYLYAEIRGKNVQGFAVSKEKMEEIVW